MVQDFPFYFPARMIDPPPFYAKPTFFNPQLASMNQWYAIPHPSVGGEEKQFDLAKAAVDALLSEVSIAVSKSDGKSSHSPKKVVYSPAPRTLRRVSNFYPVKRGVGGKRRRDEQDVGYAFNIAKSGRNATVRSNNRISSFSFCEGDSRVEGDEEEGAVISMNRLVYILPPLLLIPSYFSFDICILVILVPPEQR